MYHHRNDEKEDTSVRSQEVFNRRNEVSRRSLVVVHRLRLFFLDHFGFNY